MLPAVNYNRCSESSTGLQYYCKACALNNKKQRLKDPKKNADHNQRLNYWSYKRRRAIPENFLFNKVKARAKQLNLPFNLDKSDIVIPSHCPVLGIPLFIGEGKLGHNSPTVDKLIPELGYVKGNIAIMSWRANCLKRDGKLEEFEALVNW